jgi:release factor glutamine methyltransferase
MAKQKQALSMELAVKQSKQSAVGYFGKMLYIPRMIRDLIADTTKQFEAVGIPTARLDAEVLLAYGLDCDRIEFIAHPDRQITDAQRTSFDRLVARRLLFEPVAYITGRKDFWSFTLEVNPNVLIPRPETETIVEETLALCRTETMIQPRILDIGTGSGAIALALAADLPDADIFATDISEAALKIAKKNARTLGLENNVTFLCGNLLEPVEGVFDIIVSNPPYIDTEEYETLPPGIKNFEPKTALLAGETGLEFYESLIYPAHDRLKEKGWLLLEIGAKQAQNMRALMDGCYDRVDVRADLAGLSRVIKGRRK